MARRLNPDDARDLLAEVVRRASGPQGEPRYVVRLSDPPTASERLQLMAARLQRRPIAIMPVRCDTVEQWLSRYAHGA